LLQLHASNINNIEQLLLWMGRIFPKYRERSQSYSRCRLAQGHVHFLRFRIRFVQVVRFYCGYEPDRQEQRGRRQ